MRDAMRIGDGVLFYHSSCAEPGVAGLAEVCSAPYPDATQFDPARPNFDAKARAENPRWLLVDVKLRRKTALLPLNACASCRRCRACGCCSPATGSRSRR